MLLEIGLFKKTKQNKTKAQKKKKKKEKDKEKKSKLQKVWATPFRISTTKDVIRCSNGYFYLFIW